MMGGFLAKALEVAIRTVVAFFAIRKLGKVEQENKELKKSVEIAEDANKIDNLVEFDHDYRVRVRREFDGQ